MNVIVAATQGFGLQEIKDCLAQYPKDVVMTEFSNNEIEDQLNQNQLFILDLNYGDLNCLELIKKIRGISGLPILIVSGVDESRERIYEAINIGATDYVLKPLIPNDFVSRIKSTVLGG